MVNGDVCLLNVRMQTELGLQEGTAVAAAIFRFSRLVQFKGDTQDDRFSHRRFFCSGCYDKTGGKPCIDRQAKNSSRVRREQREG